jgi:prepilin-type N-terminal cleavage/methylation domain-containing protein/prepilin-type processing-associated H-X9-DG protein
MPRASTRPAAAGLTLLEVLVVVAILAVLMALLLPAVQQAREAAARIKCANNLRQLGLALHNHHDTFSSFPPAKVRLPATADDSRARVLYSWVPRVLPFLEQDPAYRRYRFDIRYDQPPNDAPNGFSSGYINQVQFPVFTCPSAPKEQPGDRHRGVIDYAAINQVSDALLRSGLLNPVPGPDPTWSGVLGLNVNRRISAITDGASSTLLLAEDANRNELWEMGRSVSGCDPDEVGAWANPAGSMVIAGYNPRNPRAGFGPCGVNCTNDGAAYGFHPGGAHGLFADGSVRFLKTGLDVNVLVGLMTRDQSELIPADAY